MHLCSPSLLPSYPPTHFMTVNLSRCAYIFPLFLFHVPYIWTETSTSYGCIRKIWVGLIGLEWPFRDWDKPETIPARGSVTHSTDSVHFKQKLTSLIRQRELRHPIIHEIICAIVCSRAFQIAFFDMIVSYVLWYSVPDIFGQHVYDYKSQFGGGCLVQ